jgi:energy-coupling factor transporter ATP-binding protein EcfA2
MPRKRTDKDNLASQPQSELQLKGAAPAPPPPPQGAHIIELVVENMMKVRAAHIKPKGSVVQITGKNGQGKTSVLRAIGWALTGVSDIPSRPIRKGAQHGLVKMDLGDLIVTRFFQGIDPDKSANGAAYTTRLLVEGKRREQFRTPQSVLDALMGAISFDPLAYVRMDEKDQLKTLRGLIHFDIDIDALDAEQKKDYDERRETNREVQARKTRLEAMDKPDPTLPAERVDTQEITQRLENAANHNNIVAAQRREQADKREEAGQIKVSMFDMTERIEKLKAEIADLEHSIEDASDKYNLLHAKADAIKIEEETDTAGVAAELQRANQVNQAIAAAGRYHEIEEEMEEGLRHWQKLDQRMEARAEERNQAMQRAKMPIEGLSIGDGEVLYQGLPFNQASNADQIRVSMALAMTSNPKLRVLRISDGSLLDADSMQLIEAEAVKHGFQVWIERVDSTGKVGVVMEDGNASGEEVIEDRPVAKQEAR